MKMIWPLLRCVDEGAEIKSLFKRLLDLAKLSVRSARLLLNNHVIWRRVFLPLEIVYKALCLGSSWLELMANLSIDLFNILGFILLINDLSDLLLILDDHSLLANKGATIIQIPYDLIDIGDRILLSYGILTPRYITVASL
jgi:hypothetical protein